MEEKERNKKKEVSTAVQIMLYDLLHRAMHNGISLAEFGDGVNDGVNTFVDGLTKVTKEMLKEMEEEKKGEKE